MSWDHGLDPNGPHYRIARSAERRIVVHELRHLLARKHGERFMTLMDKFMPDWRARRGRLIAAPLAAQEWCT
jgi:hypothetical protein